MSAKKSFGFTLIELLVVVALIGILSTLVIANLNSARERSRDTQRKSDLRNIQTALRLYYNDFGGYPESNSSAQILGCGAGGMSACTWGGEWTVGTTSYMKVLPTDPIAGQSYKYTQVDSDTFTIETCLENKSDTSGETASDTAWCTTAWEYIVRQQ